MEEFNETALSLVDITLEFSFGYWCFYAHPLRVQRMTKHFAELPAHPVSAREVSSLPGRQEPLSILSHPVKQKISTLEFGRAALRYVSGRYARYYVELTGTFEQYLQRINRKRRGELRRKMRKFAQAGSKVFREYRSAEEIRAFYDLALAVSRQSFQKRLGRGLSERSEFLAQLIGLANEDRIRAYILFYGERPAAFSLCRTNGSWLTGHLCGYDSALNQLSPGIVLMAYILEHLFAEQSFRMLDFGTGETPYKAFFATGSVQCADVYYFQRSLKNIILLVAHSSTSALWQWTARTLDFLRVRGRLKKLARNGWKRPELLSSGGSHLIEAKNN